MASIFGINNNSNNISSLFGSLNTNSTGNTSSFFTDWASIKNGSYKKLANSYYGKTSVKNGSQTNAIIEENKSLIKANSGLKSNTEDVKSAISALSSPSLYEKKTTVDDKGNKTTGYDYEKITKALKSFADSYNSVIDAADDSNNRGVLRNAAAMTKSTAVNQNLLSKIGITIGEDNKLSVDASKVKEAKMSDIFSLFNGSGSYGSMIESSSSSLVNQINAENNKLNSYNAMGGYSQYGAVGNIYDGTY